MKVFWTQMAREDRKSIRGFISRDNPSAALALDTLISKTPSQLARHPELGHSGRVSGTRELVAHPNYILIYDIDNEQVRMLRVLHAARPWPPFMD